MRAPNDIPRQRAFQNSFDSFLPTSKELTEKTKKSWEKERNKKCTETRRLEIFLSPGTNNASIVKPCARLEPRACRGYAAEETSIFCFHPAPLRKRELWTRGHLFTSRRLEKRHQIICSSFDVTIRRRGRLYHPIAARRGRHQIDYNDVVKGFKSADNCFVVILFIFSS